MVFPARVMRLQLGARLHGDWYAYGLTGKFMRCYKPSHQGLVPRVGLTVATDFVLRQGLRRGHVGIVVLICALAGAAIITAGVLGMPQALPAGQSLQIA